MNAPCPEDSPPAFGACPVDGPAVNERVGAETLERPRRRCEDNIRRANRATKTRRAIEEP